MICSSPSVPDGTKYREGEGTYGWEVRDMGVLLCMCVLV